MFTNHFYKAMNHNFGIEMVIRNNTSITQTISVGGCVYDDKGNTVVKWGCSKKIPAYTSSTHDFYVRENSFAQLREGKYKVQFWINNKKVQKEFFTITYK